MDARVKMTHPKLPGREIWVRERGVKARERAGWKRAKASTTAAAAAPTKKGDES